MESALFGGSAGLLRELPAGIRPVETGGELERNAWELLAVTRLGWGQMAESEIQCRCKTLLTPGDAGEDVLCHVAAEQVVGVGLDRRASLTFSSLREGAMLCVQRTLLRPDGTAVEPQEIPLPALTLPPEEALLLWGLRLLTGALK